MEISSIIQMLIKNFSTELEATAKSITDDLCFSVPSPEIAIGTQLNGWISHYEPDHKSQIFFTLLTDEKELVNMQDALVKAEKKPVEQLLENGCYVMANHPEHGWNRAKFSNAENNFYFIDFGSSMQNENLKDRVLSQDKQKCLCDRILGYETPNF